MGADSTYIFYGVRYQVSDEAEIKQLQTGDHLLIKAAKKAGLESFWGNFDLAGNAYHLLYIGTEIGTIGYEATTDVEISDTELDQIRLETKRKLASAGFSLVPALFAQFEPDV